MNLSRNYTVPQLLAVMIISQVKVQAPQGKHVKNKASVDGKFVGEPYFEQGDFEQAPFCEHCRMILPN